MSENHRKTAKGACLCGAVAITFLFKNEFFDACHCGMCRRWGGAPLLSVESGGGVTFKGQEFIGTYDSSEWAERGFCKRCGTHLFYHLKGSEHYELPLGLLADTAGLKFRQQIFIDKKPEHYSFANATATMTEAEVFAKYRSK